MRGSSPHVRGTYQIPAWQATRYRFIPARAGNILFVAIIVVLMPVHPRTCGEHLTAYITFNCAFGSSPHVRGTFADPPDDVPRRRFIPARAGNMQLTPPFIAWITVHPRTCGEHAPVRVNVPRLTGSSPHVRGTSVHVSVTWTWDRFIPARAGNIPPDSSAPSAWTVHPRTCGEHSASFSRMSSLTGSSPHVRGTCLAPLRLDERSRFIPARAGNIRRRGPDGSRPPVHPRTCGEHGMISDS